MIKDILVNVPLRAERDKTTRYAASMAGFFNAHITGIAFVYAPMITGIEFGLPSADHIAKQEAEASKLARDAIDRFEFEVRGENISSAAQQIPAVAADAPGLFANIARSYDLSVVAQTNPDKPELDELFAEAALFDSGRRSSSCPTSKPPISRSTA